VALLADLQPVVQELDRRGAEAPELAGATYFEITTAAALMYFQRQSVDCAVLEVGLGGRLDSTNICLPRVSVITTISLDHTKQLGKTLAKIAAEKAGIIKPGVPVVTGVRQQEPWAVIRDRAAEQASPLLSLGREFDYQPLLRTGAASPQFPGGVNQLHYQEQVAGESWRLDDLQLGMLGRHQAANAAVALAAMRQLRRDGWSIDEPAMRHGLQHARCPARCEIVAHHPTVILDAAHNPASVAALCDTLSEHFPRQPRLLIFAASVDKEVPAMLEQLLPCVEHVVVTRYCNNPRAMPPQQIADLAGAVMRHRGWEGIPLEVAPDPRAAWQRIRLLATPAHIVCVAGSFFLAAELREVLETAGHELAGMSLLSR
jgi:dihydrofolate synthase/folylpolyglutamate synthase